MSLGELEVRLHAGVAESVGAISRLWYVCRALSNDGKAQLSISAVSAALLTSEKTVRSWLYKGMKAKLFRSYQRNGDAVTIYFSSLATVCLEYGLKSWGATATVLVSHLKDFKVAGTEMTAQALQNSSIYAAKAAYEKRGFKGFYKKLKSPETLHALKDEYLESATTNPMKPSALCTGINGFMELDRKQGKIVTVMTDSSFIAYGTAQTTIAAKLGRHPNTVKNRLRKGDLGKVRLATSSGYTLNALEKEFMHESDENRVDKHRFFTRAGIEYKLCTYIYEPIYSLVSMKRQRARFKQLVTT